MVKWAGGIWRNHIYILNAAHLADKVYDEFIKVLQERGNILSVKSVKISKGFFRKRERESLQVRPSGSDISGDMCAVVTATAVGPDLYVGYTISSGFSKKELDEIEMQDLEAFTEYLITALKITLQRLGVITE